MITEIYLLLIGMFIMKAIKEHFNWKSQIELNKGYKMRIKSFMAKVN